MNPSDYYTLKGLYPLEIYPLSPGLEGSGVVVSEGEFKGKRVAFNAQNPYGSYAQYAIAEKHLVFEVDDNLPLQNAASGFINPGTVIGFLSVVR